MANPDIAEDRIFGASDPKYRSANAPQPRARIDPDAAKEWFWRLCPLLAERRGLLLAGLVCAGLG